MTQSDDSGSHDSGDDPTKGDTRGKPTDESPDGSKKPDESTRPERNGMADLATAFDALKAKHTGSCILFSGLVSPRCLNGSH